MTEFHCGSHETEFVTNVYLDESLGTLKVPFSLWVKSVDYKGVPEVKDRG